MCRHGADVDDLPSSSLLHFGVRCLAQDERTREIRVHDLVPLQQSQGLWWLAVADAGVVHENVTSPVSLDRLLHGRVALRFICYVDSDCAHWWPQCPQLSDHFVILRDAAADDDHGGLTLEQPACDPRTDALVAARHQSGLASQIESPHGRLLS